MIHTMCQLPAAPRPVPSALAELPVATEDERSLQHTLMLASQTHSLHVGFLQASVGRISVPIECTVLWCEAEELTGAWELLLASIQRAARFLLAPDARDAKLYSMRQQLLSSADRPQLIPYEVTQGVPLWTGRVYLHPSALPAPTLAVTELPLFVDPNRQSMPLVVPSVLWEQPLLEQWYP